MPGCTECVVLGVYLLVAVVYLQPLPRSMSTVVIQHGGDASWNLWWMWWAKRALASGIQLFSTDYLMYPTGAPLGLSRPDLVSIGLSLPLQGVCSRVVAYNVLTVVALVFGAFSMFLLARVVTASTTGALVAGAILAFMPLTSRSTNLGHLEWTNVGFLPLSILCLLRIREGHPLWTIPRAIPLALAMLVSWYQGVFLIMFAGIFLLDILVDRSRPTSPRAVVSLLARLGGWVVAALVMVSPLLLLTVHEARSNSDAEVHRDWVALNSAGPLDPFRPNPLNPWLGSPSDGPVCALGYIALILAFLGARSVGKRSRLWVLTIGTFYLLALGPSLTVGEHDWPLPYRLLYSLPLGSILRVPVRLLFIAGLALAVLVAWGVAWLGSGHAWVQGRWPHLLTALAFVGVLVEYWPGPRPVRSMEISPFYRSLARAPAVGAVLELPRSMISQAMYFQTVHGLPIVEGYFSRKRPESRRTAEIPIVRQLWIGDRSSLPELTRPDIVQQPDLASHGTEVLDAYGIRYVILHLDAPGDPERILTYLRRIFPPQAKVWDDGKLVAYQVPENSGRRGVIAGVGLGWQPSEPFLDQKQRYRWSSGEGAFVLMQLEQSPRAVLFTASAIGYGKVTEVEVELNGAALTTLRLVPRWHELRLGLVLQPGYNLLRVLAKDGPAPSEDEARKRFALGAVRVQGE